MLEIKNLKASVSNKDILKGLDIVIKPGELHAIMGPNGSGKSTLANVLSGKNGYEVSGELKYQGKSLDEIPIEEYSSLKNKLIPNTSGGKKISNYKILFAVKNKDGGCIKACLVLQDKACLITSIIYKDYQFRKINSLENGWFICQCCMMAELQFWELLNNKIKFYRYILDL